MCSISDTTTESTRNRGATSKTLHKLLLGIVPCFGDARMFPTRSKRLLGDKVTLNHVLAEVTGGRFSRAQSVQLLVHDMNSG